MANILVVDDDRALLLIMQLTLERAGFHVTTAENGDQTLKLAHQSQFDLIILDDMMPGMSGGQTCRLLKSDPRTENIPVMLYSARSDAVENEYVHDILANAALRKPASPTKVLEVVRGLLAMA
ncbi:MAG: response regulator [Chloroflexi bacterium]|nr:response regulator [Chloroflexota bacterium]